MDHLYSSANSKEYDKEWQLIRTLDTAQWHQWLRHVREHPPSIQEQQQDLVRQAQIKELGRLADERWASKPSFLDKPKPQPSPAQVSETASAAHPAPEPPASTSPESTPQSGPAEQDSQKEENPWTKASNSTPGAEWQPESWSPSAKR
jgi:NADH dehydrogenase [ubiquinone] 1 alpha subcomplex assembly factor 2